MRGRLFLGVFAAAIVALSVAGSSFAYVASPTNSSDWRALLAKANDGSNILDKSGTPITRGDWEEYVWRYGNDPSMNGTRYSALTTAERAFVDPIRNSDGSWSPNQMTLWQEAENAGADAIINGTASANTEAALSTMYKFRVAMGLAPELLSTGAIVLTSIGLATATERALVNGENKVFGWHIKLSGPFGIFGDWSSQGNTGTTSQTFEVSTAKWRAVRTSDLCGAGSTSGCPVWDVNMNSATGGAVGTLSQTCGCDKLFVLEPYVTQYNSFGSVVAANYFQDIDNAYRCITAGWWAGSGTNFGECSEGGLYSELLISKVFGTIAPDGTATSNDSNGDVVGGHGGTSLTRGQFVETRNCTHGVSNVCVAYTMTEGEMEKYIGERNLSGDPQSYAWEHDGDGVTNVQGGIDSDQPNSTFQSNPAPLTAPRTDIGRAAIHTQVESSSEGTDPDWLSCALTNAGCPNIFTDNYTAPDCVGLSVSDCVDLLESYGFTGAHVDTTLSRDGADLTKPAGSIVEMNPAGGASVDQTTEFALTVNPTPLPVEIPSRISGNEVATDWATRLEASGYTGTITYVTLDPSQEDGTVGPGVEVFPIHDTTTGEYPQPGSRIQPDDSLTVDVNPDSAPPVDPSSGTGGGSPGSTCSCPPLDMTPLTGVSYGNKFPFGLFTYAAAIVGNFNVAGQAPDFSLRAQATGLNGHNLDSPYDVNLGGTRMAWLDTYMGYWRDLLSFCMWVGAIWFFASRILGLNGTGDPGEAVDEVI